MMHRHAIGCALLLQLASGCGGGTSLLPIETSLAFTNFSRGLYAVMHIREHRDGGDNAYTATPLLAPGAVHRIRFRDILPSPCPGAVDIRVLLYHRVNDDMPIGLDPAEAVDDQPLAAAELLDLPACEIATLETYTVVVWDAEPGVGRIKIAQGTPIEPVLAARAEFANPDAAWEFTGVDPALADTLPGPLAPVDEVAGRVVGANGLGVADVVVVLRTRFRVRLNDDNPNNDPDAGYGEPIAFQVTGTDGAFAFARPAGAYGVEFFSDVLAFRPAFIELEAPSDRILTVAEPLP